MGTTACESCNGYGAYESGGVCRECNGSGVRACFYCRKAADTVDAEGSAVCHACDEAAPDTVRCVEIPANDTGAERIDEDEARRLDAMAQTAAWLAEAHAAGTPVKAAAEAMRRTRSPKLTAAQRRRVRELMEDEGESRASAIAWVLNMEAGL